MCGFGLLWPKQGSNRVPSEGKLGHTQNALQQHTTNEQLFFKKRTCSHPMWQKAKVKTPPCWRDACGEAHRDGPKGQGRGKSSPSSPRPHLPGHTRALQPAAQHHGHQEHWDAVVQGSGEAPEDTDSSPYSAGKPAGCPWPTHTHFAQAAWQGRCQVKAGKSHGSCMLLLGGRVDSKCTWWAVTTPPRCCAPPRPFPHMPKGTA